MLELYMVLTSGKRAGDYRDFVRYVSGHTSSVIQADTLYREVRRRIHVDDAIRLAHDLHAFGAQCASALHGLAPSAITFCLGNRVPLFESFSHLVDEAAQFARS